MRHEYELGLVMEKFLKLREEYRRHIEERRSALGIEGARVGVHIRGEDVMLGSDVLIDSYIQTIEQVAAATGVRTVFVATDSDAVLHRLPKDSGLEFVYDDESRYKNHVAKMSHAETSLQKQETMTLMKNIYLLADCDYVICSENAIARCALGLSYYRNKRVNAVLLQQAIRTGKKPMRNVYLNSRKLENPANCQLAGRIIRREVV